MRWKSEYRLFQVLIAGPCGGGADEYLERLGSRRFAALPREEVERLYGSVEVRALERGALEESADYLSLVTYTAAHYNYTWRTNQRAQPSLGVSGVMLADGEPRCFSTSHCS